MPEKPDQTIPRFSEDDIDGAIEFWSPRYGRTLSREEAREILVNLTGFFKVLLRWHRQREANQSEGAQHSGEGARD